MTQTEDAIYDAIKSHSPLVIHATVGLGWRDALKNVAKRVADDYQLPLREGGRDDASFILDEQFLPDLDEGVFEGVPSGTGVLPISGCGLLVLSDVHLATNNVQIAALFCGLKRGFTPYEFPEGWSVVIVETLRPDVPWSTLWPDGPAMCNRFRHILMAR